ncbi:MAG TPA: ATP-binding cassette domain-containing protein, partial [Limnochordia bacterium]|nr:ATP-binding cassette domain-containing protein [Limnochordia bacterium]
MSSEPFPQAAPRVDPTPGSDPQPVVQVEDVEREYRLGGEVVQALKGVSLTLNRGTFAMLRGRSGSGKTTLLNVMGG